MEDDEILKLVNAARAPLPVETLSEEAVKQLIQAAMTPGDTTLVDPRADLINAFIARFMRSGTQSVSMSTLYKFFLRTVDVEIGPKVFSKYMSKALTPKRTGAIYYYKIDPTAIGLAADYSMYKDLKISRKLRYGKKAYYQRQKLKSKK